MLIFNAHAANYTYIGEHSILCLMSIAYGIKQIVAWSKNTKICKTKGKG